MYLISYIGTIQSQIEARIDAISTDSGYNNDWGSVNVKDQVLMSYPSAWVYIPDDGEEVLQDGQTAGAYRNELTFVIEVRTQMTSAEEQPSYENRSLLYEAYEDIKKAFASPVDACEETNVLGFTPVVESGGDIYRPTRFDVSLNVSYSQDRNDPSQSACV